MNEQPPTNNSLNISIGGSITGDVVGLGVNVHQQKQVETTHNAGTTDAELMEFVRLLAQLKTQVETEALPAHKEVALQWVQELEGAVTAEKPDPTRLKRVQQWFARYVPAVSGMVASVVIHPIVGKLVEATGEVLATDLRQRLGR